MDIQVLRELFEKYTAMSSDALNARKVITKDINLVHKYSKIGPYSLKAGTPVEFNEELGYIKAIDDEGDEVYYDVHGIFEIGIIHSGFKRLHSSNILKDLLDKIGGNQDE